MLLGILPQDNYNHQAQLNKIVMLDVSYWLVIAFYKYPQARA